MKIIRVWWKTRVKKSKRKQKTETYAISYYLNKSYLENLPLMSTLLRKYNPAQLVTEQSTDTNCAGLETILLSIITEGSKDFAVWGSQPFGNYGSCLDDTASQPTVIHSNQESVTISRWGHGDCKISLGSL